MNFIYIAPLKTVFTQCFEEQTTAGRHYHRINSQAKKQESLRCVKQEGRRENIKTQSQCEYTENMMIKVEL